MPWEMSFTWKDNSVAIGMVAATSKWQLMEFTIGSGWKLDCSLIYSDYFLFFFAFGNRVVCFSESGKMKNYPSEVMHQNIVRNWALSLVLGTTRAAKSRFR